MNARDAIKAVAEMRGVSEQQVRADIEEAIRAAWSKNDPKLIAAQQKVLCQGEIPTPEELITYAVNEIALTPDPIELFLEDLLLQIFILQDSDDQFKKFPIQ